MKNRLFDFIKPYLDSGIVIAFSGGVDSTLLLAVLVELRRTVSFTLKAVYFNTSFQSRDECYAAQRVARELGVELDVFDIDVFVIPRVSQNPENRCYICKYHLFSKLRDWATSQGIATVVDGTHADDQYDYRPGRKALRELGIVSPFEGTGMTKLMIRQLATSYGLAVASKPASPCLATRFPYNTQLTLKALQRVAAGEAYLRSIVGQTVNIRLRIEGDHARIEVDCTSVPVIESHMDEIRTAILKLGFKTVDYDPNGFKSGKWDVTMRV